MTENRPALRPPVAWRLLLALVASKLALHALSNGPLRWGYMTDELYFLDSADRLQWGFVDHPPLSIALLGLVRSALGDSPFAIRVVPALLGVVAIVLVALIAREMGGGRRAQGLAGLATLAAPVYLAMCSYYSMNPIDEALWAAGMLLVVRLANGGAPALWLLLGAVMGIGLLNKVSMLWFGVGLAAGVVFTPARRWLRTPWPWLAAAVALACFAPFVWWQEQNQWPFLEFSRNAAEYKVGEVSLLDFLSQQVVALNAVAVPLWIGGLAYCFAAPNGRPYRPAAWIFVVTAVILAASGSSRPHYLAPAFPIVLAAGGVACERLAQRWRWVPPVLASSLAVSGALAAPVAMPLLPPAATVSYLNAIGIRPPEERERGGALPMHLGLYFHAEAVLEPVQRVYEELSPADRARVEILTGSFGETGAINVLGRKRGLPASIGRHNQYWLWGPGAATGELMIVVHGGAEDPGRWFSTCEPRAEIECPYCMEMMDAQAVYVCRGPRRPLRELWPEMKVYR